MKSAALLFALFLVGCGADSEMAAMNSMPASAPEPMVMDRAVAEGGVAMVAQEEANAQPKYLAERQFWVFELPEDQVEARW